MTHSVVVVIPVLSESVSGLKLKTEEDSSYGKKRRTWLNSADIWSPFNSSGGSSTILGGRGLPPL